VLLCALAFAGAGIAAGVARKGTYTAASTLQVGKVNPNSPGFYGFVQSASDLATVFSRAITAAPVLAAVHRRLGLSPSEAAGRLSAAPIPNSPAFRVIATGETASSAIRLADVTSDALIAYEARVNAYNPEKKRLLSEYRTASMSLATATTQASEAAREYTRYPFPAQRATLEQTQATRAAFSLRAQALASSYQLAAQSTTAGLVSMLTGAVGATNDKSSKMELLCFIGLLGGLVTGCALAVVWEQRRVPLRGAPDFFGYG